nr:chemotaxis protein CheR [Hyphomonadaceae bacterium]
MKPADFDFISKLVKERSGLVLTPEKAYLIESRLAPIARAEGMAGVEDVVQALRLQRGALSDKVVDAMTTNETFFYRDKTPFETLEQTVL